jgi:uncharacterized protein YwlG (UPF0340 family)
MLSGALDAVALFMATKAAQMAVLQRRGIQSTCCMTKICGGRIKGNILGMYDQVTERIVAALTQVWHETGGIFAITACGHRHFF